MKTSALIHIVWLVVAGAAFAVGWAVRPTGDASDSTANAGGGDTSILAAGNGAAPKASGTSGTSASQDGVDPTDISKYIDANGVITAKSMGQAVRDALNESDPLKSSLLFGQLLQEMNVDNVDEALAAIEAAPQGWDVWQKMGLFVGVWGSFDGPKALEYAQKMRGPGRMFGPAAALGGWAATDSDAAIEYLETTEMDGRQKMAGTAGILRGMATTDPAKATKYLESLPADTQGMGELVNVLANEQMKKGVVEATTWAENLSTDDLKEDAFSRLSNEYSRQDPVKASSWIQAHADKEYAVDAVAEVADEWAEIDPASAVGWATTLPDASKDEAMENAFEEWAESSPEEAGAYLDKMEPSPTRDAAVAGFVSDLGREDPQVALQWTETIDNEEVRNDAVVSVAKDWYRSDQEAAAAWLPDSGLAPETVEEITKPRNDYGDMIRRFGGGGR